MAGQRIVLSIGDVVGRWTIVAKAPLCSDQRRRWQCRCICGTVRFVREECLKDGDSGSCGCYHRERSRQCATTHGASKSCEYIAWCLMKRRCYNSRDPDYPNYGGRGICVCDQWRHSFPSFLADMGPKPSRRHSVDRIDNNGPYAPKNCRWATPIQQRRNRRDTPVIVLHGETLILHELRRCLRIPRSTFYNRLKRGWSIELALSPMPLRSPDSKTKKTSADS